MKDNSSLDNKFTAQFPKNLAANIIYFVVNITIGILLIPYFVSSLGIAAYGLIPLVTSITGYVGLIVQSLNSAISRYLTIDLQQENYVSANKTFNSSLIGFTAIVFLMIPFVIAVSYLSPFLFNVPKGQESSIIFLLLSVCMAFIVRAWSGIFTVQLFAYNRLDLMNIVNLVNLLVQTILIILFFELFGPTLYYVGAGYLIGSIAASIVSMTFATKICPYLCVSIRSFDLSKFKDIGKMSWWVVIDQIGTLFLFQIDLIVVNMLFGSTSSGEYAIALQWSILLRSVAGILASILAPTILLYYSLKQATNLINMTKSAVKFIGFFMALPTGIICVFAPNLLTIWVGAEYIYLAPLMILLTIHLAVNMSVLPLFSINIAYNKVKIPGIITIILGTTNLLLAILIPIITGWGYYGVALAGVIVLTFRHVIFVPWYASRLLQIKMTEYMSPIIFGFIALIFIVGVASSISAVFTINSLLKLTIAVAFIVLIYGLLVIQFGLNSSEKERIKSYLPQNWSKSN